MLNLYLDATKNCKFSKECEGHAVGSGPCGFTSVNFACLPTLFKRPLCLLAYSMAILSQLKIVRYNQKKE